MAMRCIHSNKRKLIAEILRNETYMPESGVIRRLTEQLMKLSNDDLGCLKLIIDIKMQNAGERVR